MRPGTIRFIKKWFIYCIACTLFFTGCKDKPRYLASVYHYIPPQYDRVQLNVSTDTISFPLSQNTYNAIKSMNLFRQDTTEYISFYDEQSGSVNIYNFQKREKIKKLKLKKVFKGQKLYKTTVYCKNFDSIYVTNNTSLYLLDSAGLIRKTIGFLEYPPLSWAVFENTTPPVFKNNILYAGVRPYVDETSLKALKEWKVLYGFDMKKDKAILYYHLPETYRENLYGYHFMDYNYCYNDRGNFVFSFPADPNLYETDLENYHVSYFGKSRYQDDDIEPVGKINLSENEEYKAYTRRDSYGPIYFDSFRSRYIRIANSKLTGEGENRQSKGHRFMIFDKNLKIIGESDIKSPISINSFLFTHNGEIYARIMSKDEYAIHFVRLRFNDSGEHDNILAQR